MSAGKISALYSIVAPDRVFQNRRLATRYDTPPELDALIKKASFIPVLAGYDSATVINLSTSGALISSSLKMRNGCPLSLRIKFDCGVVFNFNAQVVRASRGERGLLYYGVRFEKNNLGEELERVLINDVRRQQFLVARQSQAIN